MTHQIKPRSHRNDMQVFNGVNWLIRNLLMAGSLWIFYSKFYINHQVPLGSAIPAKRKDLESESAGRLNYYYEPGRGRPLVLIHSVNAAASAFEMRPLFSHYRGSRPVYALDLPGYGFSQRSTTDYTPRMFASAINEFLEKVVKKPADVIALSLGSEFAAQAALDRPELVYSLALISPSGLMGGGSPTRRAGQFDGSEKIHRLLAAPLWGQALFDLIATRVSIRYFLQKSFVGAVPKEFIDYAYATSHQPGAAEVPLYFLSGGLFTRNALEELYRKVTVPGLVLYDRDAFTTFEGLPALLEYPSTWQAQRITPTLGLPHFERLEDTLKALEDFWSKRN